MIKTGIVKSFRTKNGCGFISSEGRDIFVHFSNIQENAGSPSDLLIPGERVEFEELTSRRGPAALKVTRLTPHVLEPRSGALNRTFPDKGFGFIGSTEGDVFFHYADLFFKDPRIGDTVDYLLARVDGKLRALKIEKTYKESAQKGKI